ncbi:MAG: YcxB-like protein [Armatimonadetes bacterium]|nr:YcxB-like protein [Armatimonadota bacterium]
MPAIGAPGQPTLTSLGPLSVIAAPWRCFGTPSEAQRFTELARQYWLMAKASPPSVATVDEEMTEALGPERLEVRFRLEPSDLSGYFRHHMRWRPQMLLALACLGLVFAGIGGSMAGWTGAAVGAVLGMVGCPWLIIWLSVRQARSSPGVLADQTIYFSPRGIWSLTAGIGQGRVEWSAITELEGLPNLILLKRGPNHAIVIPRRAFEDSAAADRFLAQVTRWRLPYVPAAPPSKRRRG